MQRSVDIRRRRPPPQPPIPQPASTRLGHASSPRAILAQPQVGEIPLCPLSALVNSERSDLRKSAPEPARRSRPSAAIPSGWQHFLATSMVARSPLAQARPSVARDARRQPRPRPPRPRAPGTPCPFAAGDVRLVAARAGRVPCMATGLAPWGAAGDAGLGPPRRCRLLGSADHARVHREAQVIIRAPADHPPAVDAHPLPRDFISGQQPPALIAALKRLKLTIESAQHPAHRSAQISSGSPNRPPIKTPSRMPSGSAWSESLMGRSDWCSS